MKFVSLWAPIGNSGRTGHTDGNSKIWPPYPPAENAFTVPCSSQRFFYLVLRPRKRKSLSGPWRKKDGDRRHGGGARLESPRAGAHRNSIYRTGTGLRPPPHSNQLQLIYWINSN